MSSNLKLFILFNILCAAIFGCGSTDIHSERKSKGPRVDLRVQNLSNLKIYPIVQSGDRTEDFGIVAPNTAATIGFGIGNLGNNITVRWTAGKLNAEQEVATVAMPNLSGKQGRLTLTWQADSTWVATWTETSE